MPKFRTLEDAVAAQDYPPDHAEHITRMVAEAGTEQKILSGELVLPHRKDARQHYDRANAAAMRQKLNAADADTVKGLMDRITALEAKKGGD